MPNAGLMLVAVAAGGGGSGSYTGHLTVTIDHTKVGSTDSTDWPLYVTITNANLKTTGNGGSITSASGYDAVFASDTAGTSLLSWEVESYDGTAGTIVAHVKIPTLSHTSDTVIYLPYGNAAVTTFQGGSTGAAWNSAYKGVWHLGDGSTLTLTDSTSNSNNGTNNNGATATTGVVRGGANFSAASSQYITTANTLNVTLPTVEAWVQIAANPSSQGSVCGWVQGNGGATADKDLSIQTDGKVTWYIFTSNPHAITSPSAISTGSMHYLVGTYDGTTELLYIDGSQVASLSTSGVAYNGYSAPGFQINGSYQPGSPNSTYMSSIVDEVRISNVARSADYILATYNNISSPGTFYTVT